MLPAVTRDNIGALTRNDLYGALKLFDLLLTRSQVPVL